MACLGARGPLDPALCPTVVTEVVILLQIRHGHLAECHFLISEVPEFRLQKFRNFGMYKRWEIPEFRNSEISELQSLCMTL